MTTVIDRQTEPHTITTREHVEWTKSYCDYPASLWTLQYRFRGPSTGFNVSGVADGDDFTVAILGTMTDDMTVAGTYIWQAWLTEIADATNIIMVESGNVTVKLGFDPTSVLTVETRSKAKIILDTIDAALLAFSTSDVLEYEITTPAGSRRVKRSDKTVLTSERAYWAGIVSGEIAREEARATGVFGSQVLVRYKDE